MRTNSVAKSNGSPRFCVDYRHTLNRHIIRKSWPMPSLEFCLDAVGDALYISVADILSAFWQLPVAEEHVDRTAFVTPTVAQQVFGNQASAAQIERDFSGCGNLLVAKRSRMDAYLVEMVMFLKANFEHSPAYGKIPMIAAKDIHSCLPARFNGQDEEFCWPLKPPSTYLTIPRRLPRMALALSRAAG